MDRDIDVSSCLENFDLLPIVAHPYIAQIRAIETSKVLRKLW
jgi:hypothetical protein